MTVDAIILAGGRAARMDGADKPGLEVGGEAMLVTVARAAVGAGAGKLIVVGPERGGAVGAGLVAVAAGLGGGLRIVREEPSGAGPVPALRCGLAEAAAPVVVLLAADLPFLTADWLSALLALAAAGDHAGAILADAAGQPQWLAGCWQAAALGPALHDYQGSSLRGLLGPLRPAVLQADTAGPPPWHDCDTPADLAAARSADASRNGER
jgi:molybdopterin-guanine dinucleotide biosynthesis protein A